LAFAKGSEYKAIAILALRHWKIKARIIYLLTASKSDLSQSFSFILIHLLVHFPALIPAPSKPSLKAFHNLLEAPLDLSFLDRLALVVLPDAPANGHFHFYPAEREGGRGEGGRKERDETTKAHSALTTKSKDKKIPFSLPFTPSLPPLDYVPVRGRQINL